MAKTLTAVLFVGGHSRRMGTDKATLAFGGEPLWTRQLRLVSELEPAALWISARSRPPWCLPGVEVVLDAHPSRGPLSGLAACLSAVRTSHLLALAVDLPRMSVVELRKLWSLTEPGRGVVPVIEERFEPLCAIYPVEAAASAEATSQGNDFSLQHLIQILQREKLVCLAPVSESDRRLYQNVNTPDDLKSATQV